MPARSKIVLAAGCVAALGLAGCSSNSSSGSTASTPAAAPSSSASAAMTSSSAGMSPSAAAPSSAAATTGTVNVLSAGSLQDLMQKAVVPGFHASTGNTEVNFSAGSSTLAADIMGRIKQGDVFVSASKTADESLMGTAGGNLVSWYATFATSKLVLGYNPKSTFAADLKSKPWYDVVTEPGFRLGLTPPATDPKGVLAVQALDETAAGRKLPALKTLATNVKNQFPETNLEAEVESGQLDAGFFYLAEANSADIVTVPLTGVDLEATYTITILDNATNPTGAASFITYLLGPSGKSEMSKYGFVLASPITVTGSGVPAALTGILK